MKKLIIVYVVLIIAVVLLAVMRAGGKIPSFSFFNKAEADVNGKKISLIVAKSDNDRMKGLSGRKSIKPEEGMLFVFPKKEKYGFWMKEMLFPIDIIYLDDNTVVYVVENAPAPQGQAPALTIYKPDQAANHILELNAGRAKAYGIKKGTKITFKNI